MQKNKQHLMEGVVNGCIDLSMTPDEIMELISILQFTITTSKVMAEQEMIKGTYQGSTRMNRFTHNASKLLDIVIATAQIGHPESNALN